MTTNQKIVAKGQQEYTYSVTLLDTVLKLDFQKVVPIKSLQSLNVHRSYVACSEFSAIKDDISILGLINNAAFFIFNTVSVM